MQPKIALRIASILMILHDVGHTFGTFAWRKTTDPVKLEVIRQMTDYKFAFMGASHSFGNTFDGYCFATILSLLFFAVVLWIASNVTQQTVVLTRKILIWLAVILLCWGVDEWIFFFPFAAAITLLATLFTVIAILKLDKVAE